MPQQLIRTITILFVMLVMVACSANSTATIPPSPQPINITISPSLEPSRNALHICAKNLPNIALFVEKMPVSSQDFRSFDLILWWGEMTGEVRHAFPLGEDELVVIINQDNPNVELSTGELIALFNGRVNDWTDISLYNQPVSVWTYPPENEMSDAIRSAILNEQTFSRLAHLAPSPQAMLEAITNDPGGIGYVPKSWLPAEVSPSLIEPEIQIALRKPILALANSEPHGNLHDLLNCLQDGEGQKQLNEYYSPLN